MLLKYLFLLMVLLETSIFYAVSSEDIVNQNIQRRLPSSRKGHILFYMPFVSRSMEITYMPVIKALTKLGHRVSLVSAATKEKYKNENFYEISIENIMEPLILNASKDILKSEGMAYPPIFKMINASITASDKALRHPDLRKMILDQDIRVDMVVVSVFLGNEVGYYLAHHFKASLCLYFTGQVSIAWMDHAIGQPNHPGYMMFPLSSKHPPFSLFQKILNIFLNFFFETILRNTIILWHVDRLLDEHFPSVMRPSLLELERNASLAFHFGHAAILDGSRPVAPNFVMVGMMNCVHRPLPSLLLSADVESFISGAKHGVVYFSMGSVLQSSLMSEKKRECFISALGRLKQRVLWKWESEQMEGKPDNMLLVKWLPQLDILAHPKTVLFVSHGGQSSMQETLCYQKPVLVIPVMDDQFINAAEAVHRGYGLSLPFAEVTAESLSLALERLLKRNSTFSQAAISHGELLMDQITRPLDRCVWWIEHLLRYPGLPHLRSGLIHLRWYEFYLMDVTAFILVVLGLVFIVLNFLCRRRKRNDPKKKNE